MSQFKISIRSGEERYVRILSSSGEYCIKIDVERGLFLFGPFGPITHRDKERYKRGKGLDDNSDLSRGLFEENAKGLEVFEAGCGLAEFLPDLAGRGARVEAVDLADFRLIGDMFNKALEIEEVPQREKGVIETLQRRIEILLDANRVTLHRTSFRNAFEKRLKGRQFDAVVDMFGPATYEGGFGSTTCRERSLVKKGGIFLSLTL